ncbi:response regulator [Haliea sp. E17]|uniref:response regulator n=1 Tax=Haliea sp. E17 TaxID=3401576 RepID=UPI003AADC1F9
MQVLLVEDDASLALGLRKALTLEGFVVNHVASGKLALAALLTEPADVVILDLGLPDMDGLEVLARLRGSGRRIPVLVLTARDTLEDKITGLDGGADDYLPKPFEMQELAARLRVFERRLSISASSLITNGAVELDTAAHRVAVGGNTVDLPRREYMLLKLLMESAGKVLTRDAIETRMYSWGEEIASNALEVHVHHLRKKMPEGFIKTVRGIGYTVPGQ